MIKVAIVEDHKIMSDALKQVLPLYDIEVIFQAFNGKEMIELLNNTSIEQQPEIILTDLSMPEMDGYEVVEWLRKNRKEINIIVLTLYDSENIMLHLLKQGISAYVVKTEGLDTIVDTIKNVKQKGFYYNSHVSKLLIDHLINPKSEPIVGLTNREVKIIKMIAKGSTSKEIGLELALSSRTIDVYRERIYEKLKVRNAAALMRYALKNKLISIEED